MKRYKLNESLPYNLNITKICKPNNDKALEAVYIIQNDEKNCYAIELFKYESKHSILKKTEYMCNLLTGIKENDEQFIFESQRNLISYIKDYTITNFSGNKDLFKINWNNIYDEFRVFDIITSTDFNENEKCEVVISYMASISRLIISLIKNEIKGENKFSWVEENGTNCLQ